ncbi:Peptidase family S41 [Enhygromyxa salina]|uniref:Peptidase family S41 n=1 Tax=Enhygromyxa salina TaxID=215803 RepID=A0A2S9YTL5_9BACT|nr:Peptidase family S41 [Enhygromyxa salina]
MLNQRGAKNLIALAELGAAVRWLHPSDEAQACEWEPLLLAGIRAIEPAGTRAELAEGLRGFVGDVAPTVVVWRSVKLDEQADDAALDEPACPDPDAVSEDEGPEPEASERARPPADKSHGRLGTGRAGPPSRTKAGAASDRKQAEDAAKAEAAARDAAAEQAESAERDQQNEQSEQSEQGKRDDANRGDGDGEGDADEGETGEGETGEGETGEGETGEGETGEGETGEGETGDTGGDDDDRDDHETERPEPDADASEREDRPPLSEALFAQGEDLVITQWHRRGYAEGPTNAPGCARRIQRRPHTKASCAPAKRKRDEPLPCSRCDGDSYRPLAPGAPALVELGRGISSLVPVALWTRGGLTLPESGATEPAPSFDQRRAWDYDLRDRGTRLLAVVRTWTTLRRFFPHATQLADPRQRLTEAMCAVADDDSPLTLQATLESMLAQFGDGNGAVLVEAGAAARRWVPSVVLRWVEERVVVCASASELTRVGDVVTAIDGVLIDELIAQELARTPAANASAAIERAVARLLVRRERGATIALTVVRPSETDEHEHGERVVVASISADRRSDAEPVLDLRPGRAIEQLSGGVWYVDPTRTRRLDTVARRLRKANGVIIDLRGQLADPRASLLAHFVTQTLTLARERVPAGPNEHAELPLERAGERRVEPDGPAVDCSVVVLADSRTRGAAELELVGFERLGAAIVGSASAGDQGAVAQLWLPGGWQLRFTASELRREDGSELWGRGVAASVPVEPTLAGIRREQDELLAAAIEHLG